MSNLKKGDSIIIKNWRYPQGLNAVYYGYNKERALVEFTKPGGDSIYECSSRNIVKA